MFLIWKQNFGILERNKVSFCLENMQLRFRSMKVCFWLAEFVVKPIKVAHPQLQDANMVEAGEWVSLFSLFFVYFQTERETYRGECIGEFHSEFGQTQLHAANFGGCGFAASCARIDCCANSAFAARKWRIFRLFFGRLGSSSRCASSAMSIVA